MSDSDTSPPNSAELDTSTSTPFDGLPGIIFAVVNVCQPVPLVQHLLNLVVDKESHHHRRMDGEMALRAL